MSCDVDELLLPVSDVSELSLDLESSSLLSLPPGANVESDVRLPSSSVEPLDMVHDVDSSNNKYFSARHGVYV